MLGTTSNDRFVVVHHHDALDHAAFERFRTWKKSQAGLRLTCAAMAAHADSIATRRLALTEIAEKSAYDPYKSFLKMGTNSIYDYLATRNAASQNLEESTAKNFETAAGAIAELLPFTVAEQDVEYTAHTVAAMELLLDNADELRAHAKLEKFDDDRMTQAEMLPENASPLIKEVYADAQALVARQKLLVHSDDTRSLLENVSRYTESLMEEYDLDRVFGGRGARSENTLQDRLNFYLEKNTEGICTDLLSGEESGLALALQAISESLESKIRIPPASFQAMLAQYMRVVKNAMSLPSPAV